MMVYRAVPGEKGIIRGGRAIPSDWCRPVEDPDVLERLLPEVRGKVLRINLKSHGITDYVENCHIHHFAQRKLVYRPAVRLYGVGHRVAHNLIHHAPHQAFAFDGNDHVFEFNEIHHVVLQSADAGVVYSGCDWTFRGNVFRHNFVHQIPHGPGLGTVGVYLDDCMSSAQIMGNVVARNVSVKSTWRDPEKYCRNTSEKNIDRRYIEMKDNLITDDDPGFENMEKMDFRLRGASVVYEKVPAFKPISFERIGLYPDEFRKELPGVGGKQGQE